MAKKVRYNGDTLYHFSSSDPSVLVVGQEYAVVSTKVIDLQIYYILKEVDGKFLSEWFDDVSPAEKVYMAIAHEVPVIDKVYHCYRLDVIDSHTFDPVDITTSTVKEIKALGNNIYQIRTRNSTYIVNVI